MAETTDDAARESLIAEMEFGPFYQTAGGTTRTIAERCDVWKRARVSLMAANAEIATLTAENARLQAEVGAMRADRDAAAEDERDRLYAEANHVLHNRNSARLTLNWSGAVCGFLVSRNAFLPAERAAIRALAAQEKRP